MQSKILPDVQAEELPEGQPQIRPEMQPEKVMEMQAERVVAWPVGQFFQKYFHIKYHRKTFQNFFV